MPGDNNGSGALGSLADLDRIVHEPGRLAILAHLSVVVRADFLHIQRQTGMTGGNLSSRIAKLEEAGYTAVEKTFEGRDRLSASPAEAATPSAPTSRRSSRR